MVIVMEHTAAEEHVQKVIESLVGVGYDVHRSSGIDYTVLGAVGVPHSPIDPRLIEVLPGVREVIPISEPYKLASRTFKPEDTVVDIAGVPVGGPEVIAFAGPCSIESAGAGLDRRARGRRVRGPRPAGRRLQAAHLALLLPGLRRGGAQVDARRRRRDRHGRDQRDHGPASARDDDALRRLPAGRARATCRTSTCSRSWAACASPCCSKRGLSATIEEWLLSAEYVLAGGNGQVILCERGIRTFENYTRNTLDISAVPVVKKKSHLPIVVDPSHGTGRREKVIPMARAAVAAGADGVIIEVHHNPEKALCDGPQSLYPEQFDRLMGELRIIAPVLGRTLPLAKVKA